MQTQNQTYFNRFVAELLPDEITEFYNRYEVVASSSQLPSSVAGGLDALVLRDRNTQNLLVAFGGVGPFQNYDTATGEGVDLLAQSDLYGFPVRELLAFKTLFDPLLTQFPNDVIDIVGHSKGGVLASALYGDLLLSNNGSRVNLVFQASPVGFDPYLFESPLLARLNQALGLLDPETFAYAKSIYDALIDAEESGETRKIVSFGAENDPLAGPGSLSAGEGLSRYFGVYRQLTSNISPLYSHNVNSLGRLLNERFNNTSPLWIPSPALLGAIRNDGQPGDIIVTGRRIKKVITERVIDPRTGVLLPSGLRPRTSDEPGTATSVIEETTGRVVEYETEEVNGVDIVKRKTTYDAVNHTTNQSRVAVVQELDAQGRVLSSEIRILNNKVGIEFSDFGAILGQQLGFRLGGGSQLTGLVYSAALKTLGDNLGDVLDGVLNGQSVSKALDGAFAATGKEFVGNLKSAGIGAVTSYITAELVNAIGIGGFAGELANSAGGAVIGQIASNLLTMAGSNAAGVTAFSNVGSALGSAAGSFVGAKLASLVWQPDTIGGQIGAAVGSALAPLAVNALLAPAGLVLTPIGVAVVVFVGFLLGGLIGSIFGGTPRSGADTSWDAETNEFVVANVWSRKGGSKETARSLAASVTDTLNNFISATGGTLLNPSAVQSGSYGMRKSDFVYRPFGGGSDQGKITKRFSGKTGATDLIAHGLYQAFTDTDFQLAGGDVYVKRAFYNTFAFGGINPDKFDITVLNGNVSAAQSYSSYLANAGVINALAAAEPDSVLAAETLLTLARADELGLTKRHASD
ncbi:MAG: hypothetical protein ACKO96_41800, partial [Flammeovirgaceae bacterium]